MNAQKKAYLHLRDKVTSGDFPANSPIRPEQIGKALGISRMPVREALLQLEAEGLVSFGSNGRPMVTSRTPADIVELFEIRIALESLAAERAVSRMDADGFATLEERLSRMGDASQNPRLWTTLHDEFHDSIYEAAGMPRLLGEIRRLRQSTQPYILMYIDLFSAPEMPGNEHAELLEVLRRQDPDLARSAMADHIRGAAAGVIYRLLQKDGASALPTPVPAATRRGRAREKVR